MPKAILAPCRIEGGRLFLENRSAFDVAVARTKDCRGVLKFEVQKKKRSDAQNRFLHGCVIPIVMEEYGYDRHDMHDDEIVRQVRHHLCGLFCGTKKNRLGEDVPMMTTSEMDTVTFTEFIDWLPRWGAEQGWRIPLPNDPMVDAIIEHYGVIA